MIWFFLAGWISGAVFMILYARWWVRKHTRVVDIHQTEEEKKNERTS